MIIHKYSEYEEPEEPPFSMDDVIRSITEMMMRYHIDFNEALRLLIERGLPINEFLRDEEMDHVLDEFIERVESMKNDLHDKYDLEELTRDSRKNLSGQASRMVGKLGDDIELNDILQGATKNRTASSFYRLKWSVQENKDLRSDPELNNVIDRMIRKAEFLEMLELFYERYGERFHGVSIPDKERAAKLIREYEALESLQNELVDARERGDLFGVDEEKLKAAFGEEGYERFSEARENLMSALKEAMEATGKVEEEDGIFKLTPAAARKVGERTLRQIFAELKIDGVGGHIVGRPGEGAIEKVSTRPYEFGDSLAHLDVASSMINSLARSGSTLPIEMKVEDMEIHDTLGVARTSVVVMIDMSGSMSRFGRFYNAKRVSLALDALTRANYPEDAIHFIGFATFARRIVVGDIINLAPEPITFMGGGVNLKVDFRSVRDHDKDLAHVPRYFTNLQKGLELSRRILTGEHGTNKEIILITDGAPTAYYEGQYLYLTYPPQEKTFSVTLREVRACTDEGIIINTFMLGSDFDTGFFGEDVFMEKMLKTNRGRLFHPQPDSLTQYVLHDYVSNKRRLIDI